MSMAELAEEHADAIRSLGVGPVDVAGISTGGSIAQQLAADHPDVVDRLMLLATVCRLAPDGRALQRRVAARIRRGAPRQALAAMMAALVPPGRGQLAAMALAWLAGPRLPDAGDDLADMANTIDAEDAFDLAPEPDPSADADPRRWRGSLLQPGAVRRNRALDSPQPVAGVRASRALHGHQASRVVTRDRTLHASGPVDRVAAERGAAHGRRWPAPRARQRRPAGVVGAAGRQGTPRRGGGRGRGRGHGGRAGGRSGGTQGNAASVVRAGAGAGARCAYERAGRRRRRRGAPRTAVRRAPCSGGEAMTPDPDDVLTVASALDSRASRRGSRPRLRARGAIQDHRGLDGVKVAEAARV